MHALCRAARVGWRPGGLYRIATSAGTVRYRVVRAGARPGERPALVVGLHGFGSNERQVATMLPLDVSAPVIYLAPRAPKPEGRGFSWFDLSVGADERPVPVQESMTAALRTLHAFAEAAARAWGADLARRVLIGYSQGGALALAAALRAPGSFSAVAAFAAEVTEAGIPQVPLFIGTGSLDPFVDQAALHRRAKEWRDRRADVAVSEAEASHVVTAGHRAELARWLRPILRPSLTRGRK